MPETRHEQFDAYARQLSLFEPLKEGVFRCPLCLRDFSRSDLDGQDPALTRAHIVAGELGGSDWTLCCKPCNNDNGSHLDSHLVERHRIAASLASGSPILDARLIGDFGNVGASFAISPNKGIDFKIIDKQSNPAFVIRMQEQARSSESPLTQFKMRLKLGYSERRADLALYHSAYLLMFRYFGYDHTIFAPEMMKLREQLQKPRENLWRTACLHGVNVVRPPWLPEGESAVGFWPEGRAIVTLLRMKPENESLQDVAVFLPAPGESWDEPVSLQDSSISATVIRRVPALLEGKGRTREVWEHFLAKRKS